MTKMSSRGQIVLPIELRGEVEEGEKLLVLKNNNEFIIRRASDVSKQMLEDIEFARRTEEAYERCKANPKKLTEKQFLAELESW